MSGRGGGFVVVDASAWVARLVPQDAFHPGVKTWMERQRSGGAILLSPALLLAEVGGAVSRRTGDAQLARRAIDSLEGLPDLRLVEMDQPLVQAAARLAAELGLRGADSFYVALAARLKIPLVTLDSDQSSRAAAVIVIEELGIRD